MYLRDQIFPALNSWRTGVKKTLTRQPIMIGILILTLCYTFDYLSYPQMPGNTPEYPLGWWGWFDQGQYLKSIVAFTRGNLDPSQHWYPLGYPLLGTVLYRQMHQHPYFFIDLVALLSCFLAFFSLCRRLSVSGISATLIFLFCVLSDQFLFDQWVIPWTTTASAAFIWLLLANTAAWLANIRRALVIGLLLALIPMVRPTDLSLALPCCFAIAIDLLNGLRTDPPKQMRLIASIILAFIVPATAYLALYHQIYGWHQSAYMMVSKQIGFSLHDFAWKAYVILIDPQSWFMDGEGLLRRCPWLFFGFVGIIVAPFRKSPSERAIVIFLSATILTNLVLYLSYVDFQPTSLWRYDNIHYLFWLFPAYGLLGWLWLKDLLVPQSKRSRMIALIALTAVFLLSCIHITPKLCASPGKSKMVAFRPSSGPYTGPYAGALVQDQHGRQKNIFNIRLVPTVSGLRAIAVVRSFRGPVSLVPGTIPLADDPSVSVLYYRMSFRFGAPCWIPNFNCEMPSENPLLPKFSD